MDECARPATHIVLLCVDAAVVLDPLERVVHEAAAAAGVARGAVAVHELLRAGCRVQAKFMREEVRAQRSTAGVPSVTPSNVLAPGTLYHLAARPKRAAAALHGV
mgnify:CR=1 FL=1